MKTVDLADLSPLEIQNYLQYVIGPRPIALVSTISANGDVNLSPFSFFNIFSMNPPICVFSPSRRVRDNTTKHTHENLAEVPECVIHVVTRDMVHQTSLSSTEYGRGINEFTKAGFTAIASELVRPPRVAESPVQMECVVNNIIPLGDGPGGGNLVLAEVKLIHLSPEILNSTGTIEQEKLNFVARLGGDYYAEISPANLFKVAKPVTGQGIGIDRLPHFIRESKHLTPNHLAQLANINDLPTSEEVKLHYEANAELKQALESLGTEELYHYLHKTAHAHFDKGQIKEALLVLLGQRTGK